MNNRSSKSFTESAIKDGWEPVKSEIDFQPWMNAATKFDSIYEKDGKAVWKVRCPHCHKAYYPGSTVVMSRHKRICRGWQALA